MPEWTDYLNQEKPEESHWTDFLGKEWKTIKSIPAGIISPATEVAYPMARGVVETIAGGMKEGKGTERIHEAAKEGVGMAGGMLKNIGTVAIAGTSRNPIGDYLLNKQIEEQGVLGGAVIPTAMLVGAVKGGLKLAEGGEVAPTTAKPEVETPSIAEPVKPTVEIAEGTKPSRLAVNTEQRAIARGIEADFGDLPTYETMNMEHQAQMASDFIKADRNIAYEVGMGRAIPPEGLRAGSVYKALEIQALHNNDVNTILDLSKSNLATKYSAMGQEIKALDVGDPESPVKAIKDVTEIRKQAVRNRLGEGTVQKARTQATQETLGEIRKFNFDKSRWSEFIDSIRC